MSPILLDKDALTEGRTLYEQLRMLAAQREICMCCNDQHKSANDVITFWGNSPIQDRDELETLFEEFIQSTIIFRNSTQ